MRHNHTFVLNISMQEFHIDKKYIILTKGCLVVFLSFLALGIALPFLPGESEDNPNETISVSILCIVVFGSFTLLTWRFLKKIPYYPIAADEEGIWYKHIGRKKGLVPWKRIAVINERAFLQCLDLIDSRESRLIPVEYQLQDFEILRGILQERIRLPVIEGRRKSFSKSMAYHLFYAFCIIGFSCLGIFLGADDSPILGYGGAGILVTVIVWEYLVTVTGVEIINQSLKISFPIGEKSVAFADITNIRMSDTFVKGNRQPEVWVETKSKKKPYKLKQLGVDANVLFSVLCNAIKIPT